MPRPKTPYWPPSPPSRIKLDSLLWKFGRSFSEGQYGTLRGIIIISGVCGAAALSVLLDAFVFRPKVCATVYDDFLCLKIVSVDSSAITLVFRFVSRSTRNMPILT